MQKNDLARKIELLLNPNQDTCLESIPCWNWIQKKLLELAAKSETSDNKLCIEIYFRENGSNVCYTLYKNMLVELDKQKQEFNFSLEEVQACQAIAEFNGINYSETFKPAPGFEKLISFFY